MSNFRMKGLKFLKRAIHQILISFCSHFPFWSNKFLLTGCVFINFFPFFTLKGYLINDDMAHNG